jgi:hypothetical protein
MSHLKVVNKLCRFVLFFLNESSAVIFIYFHQHYLYHYILHLFVFKVFFLSFRATFCFPNPDYRSICMTVPPLPQLIWISEGLLYVGYEIFWIRGRFYGPKESLQIFKIKYSPKMKMVLEFVRLSFSQQWF